MNNPKHFETVSQILYWLLENQHEQPGLARLSRKFGISEYHLQKVFQDFAGVSPKQFLKYLSKEEAVARLRSGQTVLDTAIDLGLSGPGRLHDLLVTTEAVTPGQVRNQTEILRMEYGFGTSPFGDALIAWTDRGISFLGFCHLQGREDSFKGLANQWKGIGLTENQHQAVTNLENIFSDTNSRPIDVWLRGSPFQLRVWEALLKIPPSVHCTYGQIAGYLGTPKASRAVGTAIGRNPISWLVPCHRVITSMGALGGYRWGLNTKKVMIGLESSRCEEFPKAQSA